MQVKGFAKVAEQLPSEFNSVLTLGCGVMCGGWNEQFFTS